MKRLIWAIALALVAVGASVTPPLSAAASHPCYEHDCHNGLECFLSGCLNGCTPLGTCNPSGDGGTGS